MSKVNDIAEALGKEIAICTIEVNQGVYQWNRGDYLPSTEKEYVEKCQWTLEYSVETWSETILEAARKEYSRLLEEKYGK